MSRSTVQSRPDQYGPKRLPWLYRAQGTDRWKLWHIGNGKCRPYHWLHGLGVPMPSGGDWTQPEPEHLMAAILNVNGIEMPETAG